MTRAEALRRIGELHTAWSLRHGDTVPYVAADEHPHDGQTTDLSLWQADRSAPAKIDDPLNEQIVAILAELDDPLVVDPPAGKQAALTRFEEDLQRALELADSFTRAAVIDQIVKEQPRDDHGRFASGGGQPEPAGGGTTSRAVRASLGRAKTTDEVSAVLASEASRISGRTVHADLTGADVDVARDYAEGVLQGFERFPNTRVQVITTYGPGSARPELFPENHNDMAVAGVAPADPNGFVYHHAIGFNTKWSNQRGTETLDHMERTGFTTAGGHQSTAVHEYGHHVARVTDMDSPGGRSALTIAREQATATGSPSVAAYTRTRVSKYASKNQMELAAEAFAESMIQGGAASDLSRAIFDEMTARYDSRNP